jgi:single-stranded-DNA-specific exonuclease
MLFLDPIGIYFSSTKGYPMQKTIVRRKFSHQFNPSKEYSEVLKRIYAARGITSADALDRDLKKMLPYQSMKNIQQAAAMLADAVQAQQRLLIVGDFDADGATSTALAMRVLKAFGAQHVDYLVPNRFKFGYGLTPEIVEVAAQKNPDIIITVDNGIANHAGVLRANALGVRVLITDHHLPGETLPEAEVIVNPNQGGDEFPSKNLAGVGVIFYLMVALRWQLSERHWFKEQSIESPNLADYLDIVALGTVADVVPLDHNNRVLVYQGLRRIRAGRCVAGITALLCASKRAQHRVVATDLGFGVGPRLNAAGRMDDMSIGIECLLTDNQEKAAEYANTLDAFNRTRREVEKEMQEEAVATLSSITLQKEIPHGLCFYQPTWHQGVIGIVASRLKDKVHRPVIAFANSDEETLKGSCRSIPGVHIRDVLALVAARHPKLLTKFGGHAMAAGLSLAKKDFEAFCVAFKEAVKETVKEEDLEARCETDGELSASEMTLEVASQLRDAGPWGQGFPEPTFDGVFHVVDQRLVGQHHLKMVVSPEGSDLMIDGIAFFIDTEQWPSYRCDKVHLVYKLDCQEYRGKISVQLIIDQIVAIS